VSNAEWEQRHLPVMPEEVAQALSVRPGGRYVDATVGEGGHAARILEDSAPGGLLLAIDRDEQALTRSTHNLQQFGDRVLFRHASYDRMAELLAEVGWGDGADGVLLDLGVSTMQVTVAGRGFSFRADGPLDMRMDQAGDLTAADVVAKASERELADILYRYGEERASRRIARAIVRRRAEAPLRTTGDLRAAVVEARVAAKPGRDVATRTFQALRIVVNDELGHLARFLESGWRCLRVGGRMAILSYHSLEDRMVKDAIRLWAADCHCPVRHPVCTCGWTAKVRRVTRRKLRPTDAEVARNPRARSAGLRVVERVADE
jgi:16S rRNA (cytosine1402-N4)-methyltransferase